MRPHFLKPEHQYISAFPMISMVIILQKMGLYSDIAPLIILKTSEMVFGSIPSSIQQCLTKALESV